MNWEVIKPTFYQGLEVMLYGLLGVFAVLILFYIVVTLLGRIPEKNQKANKSGHKSSPKILNTLKDMAKVIQPCPFILNAPQEAIEAIMYLIYLLFECL